MPMEFDDVLFRVCINLILLKLLVTIVGYSNITVLT